MAHIFGPEQRSEPLSARLASHLDRFSTSCQIPHVLTVVCFYAGALCFVVFVAAIPDGLIIVAIGLVSHMYPA